MYDIHKSNENENNINILCYSRLCREISFKFRTRLPHGLLVYHNVKNPVFKMPPYALYVIVEKGELKGNLTLSVHFK